MSRKIDPDFPKFDEDFLYLTELDDIVVRPIFIMGLHRSGTTFLYDSVAKCFPVANIDLYHIFYFDRLIGNAKHRQEASDRKLLNRYFRSLDITDRKIDKVWVEDSMVEEYGWLLRNKSYAMSITEDNCRYFELICKKLHYLDPEAQAVLLKNPLDTNNAEQILKWFPEAKFIYISREPVYILNSMTNAILTYLHGSQPFLSMLIARFKMPFLQPILMGLIYGAWKLARAMNNILGDDRTRNMLVPRLTKIVEQQIEGYFTELNKLPPECHIQLSYDEFNEAPSKHLEIIAEHFSLSFSCLPNTIVPQPRKKSIDPLVQKYGDTLNDKFKDIRNTIGSAFK